MKNKTASDAARELGRRGGLKGGPARAKKLSARKRSEIARLGNQARKKKKSSGGWLALWRKRKLHYFRRDSWSLCRKWAIAIESDRRFLTMTNPDERCQLCSRALDAE